MNETTPILLYHSIGTEASPKFRPWVVSPGLFAAHLNCLAQEGYTPLTVTQFLDTRGAVSRPRRPVIITFDDGLADFHEHALPALAHHQFPSTLYITTGYVGSTSRWLNAAGEGSRPMMSWSQIADLEAGGVECGAHSHTHPQLDLLPLAKAREEIFGSKQILEDRLGHPVASFAYPHGYYNQVVRRLVEQAGFASACAVKHALSSAVDDPFALARIIVTADTDILAFRRLLAGEGLQTAPAREKMKTKGWRLVRQSLHRLGQDAWIQ